MARHTLHPSLKVAEAKWSKRMEYDMKRSVAVAMFTHYPEETINRTVAMGFNYKLVGLTYDYLPFTHILYIWESE